METTTIQPSGLELDLQPYCEAVKSHFDAAHVYLIVETKNKTMVGCASDGVRDAVSMLVKAANNVLVEASNGALSLHMQSPDGIHPVPQVGKVGRFVAPLRDGKEGAQ